jgi:hypothetical protein
VLALQLLRPFLMRLPCLAYLELRVLQVPSRIVFLVEQETIFLSHMRFLKTEGAFAVR